MSIPARLSRPIQILTLGLSLILFLNWTEYGNLAFFSEVKYLYRAIPLAKASFYLAAYLMVILSYVAILLNEARLPRRVLFVLSLVALTAHFTFFEINGYGLKLFEMRIVLQEAMRAREALRVFGVPVFHGFLKAFACTAALFLPLLFRMRLRPAWLLIVPLSFVMAFVTFYKTSGTRDVFPAAYRAPLLAGLVVFGTGDQMYYGPKDLVRLKPETAGARKIVFVVDESVRGDFLTVNNSKIHTTPFLYSVRNRFVNLGIATSGANCSVDSNTILRTGIQFRQLPDKEGLALRLPSHFQYAKAAGYRTYYLDAQASYGELTNHLSKYDLNAIDEFIYMRGVRDEVPNDQVDMDIAVKIAEILKKNEKSFIVANKTGAHFLYNERFPSKEAVFQPVMTADAFATADLGEMMNSYSNAVRWDVDIFFKNLFPALETTPDLAFVYTSDHGVSFGGAGDHCAFLDSFWDQAIVPLLITGSHAWEYFDRAKAEPNHSTHYSIFPSLLVFMGQRKRSTVRRYGTNTFGKGVS